MEESEKRRERLKAMRMDAAQTGVYSPGLKSGGLSNPLIESETASASPLQYTSPRFDYYTDPMSAFAGSKRRNNISPLVSQGHYNTPPRPVDHQGTIPNPVYHHPAVNSPGPRMMSPVPGAHFNQGHVGSPIASPLNRPQGYPPNAWAGGGAFNYSTPNFSRSGNFTSPGFRPGGSPYVNYGSGCGRGRGRSFGNNMSPGSGPSFRRGSGLRDSVSADQRPDLYYSKDMVEDPWQSLSPVIWKGVGAVGSNEKSWLPKSIAVKKMKVSPEASISQQNLAEYLAATFNDSIDEAVDDDEDV